jgi:hypothetical protein
MVRSYGAYITELTSIRATSTITSRIDRKALIMLELEALN